MYTSRLLLPLCLALLLIGCAADQHPSPDDITVAGKVGVYGNEPFTAQVLETPDRLYYILVFDERPELSITHTYRVSGTVYRADWNGRPYAHLRVTTIEEAAD